MLCLPTELYRPIVEFVTDQPTLYSLLFVSSIFNYEAERVLYRKISPKDTKIQEKVIQHLQDCDRAAKLVLDLRVHASFETYTIASSDLFWSSLSLALRALINLKTLSIWTSHPYPRMVHMLDGCPFQLESFNWPCPLEEKLVHFLENQPHIRRLQLKSWSSNLQISSNALPRLVIFAGNANAINALLPGRNISHLYWDVDLFDDEPDVARIGSALDNIRVLKYGSYFPAPRLHTIMNYLGNLEVLEWDQPRPQEITKNASFFPNLQKIIFPYVGRSDPQKLFASVPSLRSLDLGHVDGPGFQWSRGSDVPKPIIKHPDDWMFY